MSVSLSKGTKVNLAKASQELGISKLSNVAIGLGWDCNEGHGYNFDLDAWAMAIGSNGLKKKNLVYYGNLSDSSNKIHHCGDNLTGAGEGDDETITIKLDKLPDDYFRILVGVTIYDAKSRRQSFKDVNNTFIRIYDMDTSKEICIYRDQFKNDFGDCTSMLFGILEKTSDGWEFIAIGKGGKQGSITGCLTSYKEYEMVSIDKITNKNNENGGRKTMAVSLSKGGKVSLAKVAADAGISQLTKIYVGLGWDTNRYDGGYDFDLDASAFMLGANGKVRNEKDFIFYGNLEGPGIKHHGDERTGATDGDDEKISIDLTAIPSDVEKIAFTVTIDQADLRGGQNFGMVENSYIHIMDEVSGTDLIKYDLGEDFSVENTIVVGELYRHNGEWKFNAIGSGFTGGLKAICANYGVDAE